MASKWSDKKIEASLAESVSSSWSAALSFLLLVVEMDAE
jgi:hypothetical protein